MDRKPLIIFDSFGPYHWARLCALNEAMPITALELYEQSCDYQWTRGGLIPSFDHVIAFERASRLCITIKDLRVRIGTLLSDLAPSAVAVPGWGYAGSLAAIEACHKLRIPIIMMSDSTAGDSRRMWHKERVKALILKGAASALVAGTPHREYLTQLGFARDRLFDGYDVVDNEFFLERSRIRKARCEDDKSNNQKCHRYMLAAGRMLERKNFESVIEAYSRYVNKAISSISNEKKEMGLLGLCLLGSGPLYERLIRQCRVRQLKVFECAPWEVEPMRNGEERRGVVFFPGFRQHEELAEFYSNAAFFVHASYSEQWGLVVNEAMASGLAVLVSNQCGCVRDLVKSGLNGYVFDPGDAASLADLMLRFDLLGPRLGELGAGSEAIIRDWGLERFVSGFACALEAALSSTPVKISFSSSMTVKMLLSVGMMKGTNS